MRHRGVLITLEGPEGSGKTTIAKRLVQRLKGKGFAVLFTLEPGGTPLSVPIRKILLHSSEGVLDPLAELFLFEADRAQHVATKIIPALRAGRVVVCVRFYDSTTAYQGYGRGLDLSMIRRMNQIAAAGLKPDLTFLFDVPVELGLYRARRAKGRLDRFERERLSFHLRIRRGFLAMAKREARRFVVLSSRSSTKELEERAWDVMKRLLVRKRFIQRG